MKTLALLVLAYIMLPSFADAQGPGSPQEIHDCEESHTDHTADAGSCNVIVSSPTEGASCDHALVGRDGRTLSSVFVAVVPRIGGGYDLVAHVQCLGGGTATSAILISGGPVSCRRGTVDGIVGAICARGSLMAFTPCN